MAFEIRLDLFGLVPTSVIHFIDNELQRQTIVIHLL